MLPWVPICFALSVWARPDYLVFEVGLLALCFMQRSRQRDKAICIATALLLPVLYFYNTIGHNSYPMVALVQQAVAGPFPYPPMTAAADLFSVYLDAVRLDLQTVFSRPLIYGSLAALAYTLVRGDRFLRALAVLAFAIIFFRVFLLPIYESGVQERFFFPSYLTLLYCLACSHARSIPASHCYHQKSAR